MDQAQLDPIAEILVQSYLDTVSYRRLFRDEHGQPPTVAAQVHHLRAVAQAMVNRDDRFLLGEEYVEFGRVEITDRASTDCYLLRSDGAVTIEQHKQKQREALFNSALYLRTDVILLVYK